jgi:hypothetical protein
VDHSQIIPEKELTSILTEIYITDGLLTIPKIHHMFYSLDSISSYFYIIDKHGYSKEAMDNTLKYYFIRNPKKLISIYDQVLGKLSVVESYLERESALEDSRNRNLWKGEDSYSFPDNSSNDSISLDLTLFPKGSYILTFTATVFPDDQTLNPRLTIYSCHPDSTYSGKRNFLETFNYIKDGQPHNYSLNLVLPPKKFRRFIGNFYSFDNQPVGCDKHAIIENILILNSSSVI